MPEPSLSSVVDEVDVEAGRAADAVDAADAIEVAELIDAADAVARRSQ